jgi:tRNA (mo5U34)-methyltransferase
MTEYGTFFDYLRQVGAADAAEALSAQTEAALGQVSHGDFDRWRGVVDSLPEVRVSGVDFTAEAVRVGVAADVGEAVRAEVREKLMALHPWRKGPFEVFGIHVDSEWRSNLKWARLQKHIDLKDRIVLDVGSGNGYYLYRMLGAGAKAAVGVDPYLLSVTQFMAINRYTGEHRAAVLPLGVDDVPAGCGWFDTVFSMGLLYHRRDPQSHLRQLASFLRPGGEVVLETLVLDTDERQVLVPEGRYAKMRNVWAVPACGVVEEWLAESGFEQVRRIDVAKTTGHEQRKTDWMQWESLEDFLDPICPERTIEGHPAPVRGMFRAVFSS